MAEERAVDMCLGFVLIYVHNETYERGFQMKVIIVGGGWSGCAASLSARKRGAEVVLLERTDMLLGTGLVGGIMRNNGRFTAAEEIDRHGRRRALRTCRPECNPSGH